MKSFNIVDSNDRLTSFADLILDDEGFDPYLEDDATLWLLHYQLVKNNYASVYSIVFNELRRDVPGISQRMLTLDLRALEEVGLIKRTVYPTVPVKVEYELTEDGNRLRPVVDVMQEFGVWLKQTGRARMPEA